MAPMAAAILKPGAFGVGALTSCSRRRAAAPGRSKLRVQAAAETAEEAQKQAQQNKKEAQDWISNWRKGQEEVSDRTSWFPGSKLPKHLNGSLPADFGFDIANLGEEPEKLNWYVQAELVHCRFAMLGIAGILLPEVAAKAGIAWPGAGVPWYDAGKFEYFAPASTLFGVQMLLFAWAELRRYQDIVKPGSANQDPIFTNNKLPDNNEPGYPGGIFDPFGYSKKDLTTMKVKEIKNGRLAMLAFIGCAGQAYTTHDTPINNLLNHVADPWNTTVWSNDLSRL